MMNVNQLPSCETLNKLLSYDSETGKAIRKTSPAKRVKVGDEVGCVNSDGYKIVMVDKVSYLLHRIIWKMVYGYDPVEIDHINKCRNDNRIINLCEITHTKNMSNKSKYKSNSSGITGVHWYNATQKWKAGIRVDNKIIHLGYFQTKLAAAYARHYAEIKYGFTND